MVGRNMAVDFSNPRTSPQLVGRDSELARILDIYKSVELGNGATIVVRGTGGLGKSRLAEAVRSRTAAMGAVTLRGQARTFDSAMPYAMVTELMAQAPKDLFPIVGQQLETLLQRRSAPTDAGNVGHLSSQELLVGVTNLLHAIADKSTVVIVWDDLHLADADSVSLFIALSRVITRTRVMQIATIRNRTNNNLTHLGTFVAQSQNDPGIEIVDLRPLDRSELRSLVLDMLEHTPGDEVVDAVDRLSQGNPYFAIEAVQQLSSSRHLVVDDHQVRMTSLDGTLPPKPDVLHRFFDAGTSDTAIARLLSAFHRVSVRYLPLISSILDLDEQEVAASFDRLAASQTLAKVDDEHYEFTHSLLRDALYDDIGPAEKRRFHAQIADFLRSERERMIPVDVAELAIHLAESADPQDPACAAVLAEAGQRSFASAPLVSAQWFHRAASFLTSGTPQWAGMRALEARCLFLAARPLESVAAAIDALEVLPDGLQRARTLADTINSLYIAGELRRAVDLIDAEDRRTGSIPLALAAQRDHFRTNLGHIEATTFAHDEGLDKLSTSDRSVVLSHDMLNSSLSVDQSFAEHAAQLLVEVLRESNTRTSQSIRGSLALGYFTLGSIQLMDHELDEYQRLNDNEHVQSIGCQIEVCRALSLYLRGRWAEALDYCTDLLWHMKRNGATISEALVRCAVARIHAERGDIPAARDALAAASPQIESMRIHVENANNLIRLRAGDTEEARSRLEQLIATQLAVGFGGPIPEAIDLLVDAHLALDDVDAARRFADVAETLCQNSNSVIRRMVAHLTRAAAYDDLEAATAAIDLSRANELTLYHARALFYSGCLTSGPSDHLLRAFEIFDQLGALSWRQRAASEMRTRRIVRPKGTKRPKGLFTDTEISMIRLLMKGHSNKEIASMLNYSVKTVEVYLSRIYSKTDSRSRVDLVVQVESGKFDLDS